MTTTQHRSPESPTDRSHTDGRETVGGDVTGGTERAWLVVALREIVVRMTNRAFLVSTLVTLVFIAGYGAFSVWQAGRTSTYTVAVDGRRGVATRRDRPPRRRTRRTTRSSSSRVWWATRPPPAPSWRPVRPTRGCTRAPRAGR